MITICLPDEQARTFVGELPADVEVLLWDGSGAPPDGIERVQYFVARYMGDAVDAAALKQMRELKAIQLISAGVEPWLDRVPSGVALYNGRGVHGSSTAELAIAGIVSTLRELPLFAEQQRAHVWREQDTSGLASKRVLVLGAGDIGRRIGGVAEILDAQVSYVARSARDGVHSVAELPALLPVHDVVVLALPDTPETSGIVDARFLAALPDGALLVNIARGTLVVTDALLAELTARRLHAVLDVIDPEPLPADHPLWDAPNLVLFPHVGGGTTGWQQRAYGLIRAQILRLVAGAPLVNRVGDAY